MQTKDNPEADEPAYQPEPTWPSDTDRVLDTLDKVFTKFGSRLQDEAPKPFTGNAKIAVGVFNDIVAGLTFEAGLIMESRPRPIAITAMSLSPTEIELTWTDVANNVDGYRVERCEGRNCQDLEEIAQLPSPARSYRDDKVFAHTHYRYRVVAFSARGETPSNIVNTVPATRWEEK